MRRRRTPAQINAAINSGTYVPESYRIDRGQRNPWFRHIEHLFMTETEHVLSCGHTVPVNRPSLPGESEDWRACFMCRRRPPRPDPFEFLSKGLSLVNMTSKLHARGEDGGPLCPGSRRGKRVVCHDQVTCTVCRNLLARRAKGKCSR